MARVLVLGSRNRKKLGELADLLEPHGFVLKTLADFSDSIEVEETGDTFAANARLKATAVSQQVAGWILADDSGLEVDSFGGKPGVHSARFAGKRATDAENRARLLGELAKLPRGTSRAARFRCVLALAEAGEVVATFEGVVEGEIATGERGTRGFGYDSLFQPRDQQKTFAEMSAAEKDRLSHRGAAVEQLAQFFRTR